MTPADLPPIHSNKPQDDEERRTWKIGSVQMTDREALIARLRQMISGQIARLRQMISGQIYASDRKTLEEAANALASERQRLPKPDFHWQYSHHYTAENVAAIVNDLKAIEDGTEFPEWKDRDHRVQAGILWRVISALSHEIPIQTAPTSERQQRAEPVAWRALIPHDVPGIWHEFDADNSVEQFHLNGLIKEGIPIEYAYAAQPEPAEAIRFCECDEQPTPQEMETLKCAACGGRLL